MCRVVALFFAVLAVPVLGFSLAQQDDKNRPVSKVISLLQDMVVQLKKEAEEDEAIYDKMACWCETNDREKTKAIKEAEARIASLTSQIGDLTATSARLNAEIKDIAQEVAQNQKALDDATALRKKELAEFNEEDKDLIQSIRALKAAVTVLSKHHSLVQIPRTHMLSVAATLQHEMEKNSKLLAGVLAPSQRRMAASFIQAFDAQPAIGQGYAPQSGAIFGIMQQMLETFEANLSNAQKEELAAQQAFDQLKAAKEEEIAAGTAQVDAKTDELAKADNDNAVAKQDVKDTKASLSADEKFLMMLKEKCSLTDNEWDQRQKTRNLEIEAVSKALAVLSSDDSHDLFSRTLNFLQTEQSERRSKAAGMVADVAQKMQNPRLSTLATQIRLAPFVRVKEAIDKMVAQLLEEKKVEIEKRDMCISDLNKNQMNTEAKSRDRDDLAAKIADLTSTIESLSAAISELEEQIAFDQNQVKVQGEDREKANNEFQKVLADQRETQAVIQKAKVILEGYYQDKDQAFLQKQPEAPAGFSAYKDQDGNGVIGLMDSILADAKAEETETIRAEEDSQKAYEDFVKLTNEGLNDKNKDLNSKREAKAKNQEDLVTANTDHKNVELDLTQLSNLNADLHTDCDFTLKNFDVRQAARDEEVEALRRAKQILSGADFGR